MARPAVLDSFSHFPHINTRLVHIYIACSRQVPARRPNQSAPEIVSISSEGLVSIASTRIRCWGGSAASENRVYLMDWVQSRPQGFTVHRLCVGSLVRECISQALVLVLRAPHGAFSPATTRSEPCRMAERRTLKHANRDRQRHLLPAQGRGHRTPPAQNQALTTRKETISDIWSSPVLKP